MPGTTLVTPNLAEARRAVADAPDAADAPTDALAGTVRAVWDVHAVCVTAGATGAFLGFALALWSIAIDRRGPDTAAHHIVATVLGPTTAGIEVIDR